MSSNPLTPITITVQPRWVEEGDAEGACIMVGKIDVAGYYMLHESVWIASWTDSGPKKYGTEQEARAACEAYLAEWVESLKGGAE